MEPLDDELTAITFYDFYFFDLTLKIPTEMPFLTDGTCD